MPKINYECEFLACSNVATIFVRACYSDNNVKYYPVCDKCSKLALQLSWNKMCSEKEYARFVKANILR